MIIRFNTPFTTMPPLPRNPFPAGFGLWVKEMFLYCERTSVGEELSYTVYDRNYAKIANIYYNAIDAYVKVTLANGKNILELMGEDLDTWQYEHIVNISAQAIAEWYLP